jgi:carbohydrate-selective porin OprB
MPTLRLYLIIVFLITPQIASTQTGVNETLNSLDRHGLSFSVDYYADMFSGSGGDPHSPALNAAHYFDISGTLDLSRLPLRLAGTTIFASYHQTTHIHPDFRGETQIISSVQDDPRSYLAELWVQRSLSRFAQIRAGKIDGNRDFAYIENGYDFLNSSLGYSPTFITLPNYGQTRWGGELLLSGTHWWTNTALFASGSSGAVSISELGSRWSPSHLDGRLGFGYWRTNTALDTFSGLRRSNSAGFYVVGEQKVWRGIRARSQGEQSVAAYIQLGSAPSDVSTFTRHIGTGVVWSGPWNKRDADTLGLAISMGRLTTDPAAALVVGHESVFELFYKIQLPGNIYLTPDLQYIRHPGGTPATPNALAFGARMNFSFNTHQE